MLRDIFGNPFRPVELPDTKTRCLTCGSPRTKCEYTICYDCGGDVGEVHPWVTPAVQSVAEAIYDERAFGRLPVLADMLQEAGCDNEAILEHLRGPGPHVRGCHVLDILLGKE